MLRNEKEHLEKRPLGVGVIGLGNWSYQLGQAIRRSPQVNLISCYTRTVEKRERYAETFDCAAAATLQELFDTAGLEAVVLTTPAHTHDDLTMACARQGLHVFVEKPMSLSVPGALRQIAACRENGVALMVGHEMRRLGSIRAAKQLLQDGALGTVVSAVASMTLRGRFEPDNWRCHRATNRGGALMQLGSHPIENLNYLLGRPLRVRGALANAVAPNNVADVGSAIISYEGGVEATVSANYVSPSSQRLSLYGTRASLHQVVDMRVWPDATLVDDRTELWLEDGQDHHQVSIAARDVLVEQLEDFSTSVRTSTAPETGGEEGLWAVAVVEGAMRSNDSGRAIELDPLIDEYQEKGTRHES